MDRIAAVLNNNIQAVKTRFEGCDDAVFRELTIGQKSFRVFVVYMDSMMDRDLVEGVILKNMMYQLSDIPKTNALDYILENGLPTADIKQMTTITESIDEVLKGNTAIFLENIPKCVVISSKNLPGRGVQSAETEVSVRGSKESFTESFRINTVLIRRRIRDTQLKVKQQSVGVRSKTDVALMYMSDLVRKDILDEIEKRLSSFSIDGIMDSGVLEQLTEEAWYSPFPQFQSTERPDKAASAILEGRIVLVVDNSPMVLILPATLSCFYQASDDYYERFEMAAFVRVLRYAASVIAMLLPGLYIAAAAWHPEIFPLSVALTAAASREGVPMGVALEVLLMEIAFELLREAGIRLPGPMGSALGIVGGLIIGQAAVDAHLVSPLVVIVVALTALSAFTIPNDIFAAAFRMIKFYLIAVSAFWGLTGLTLGAISVLVHLCSLESFGVPYMLPYAAASGLTGEDKKDGIFRYPVFMMKERPVFTRKGHRRRLRGK